MNALQAARSGTMRGSLAFHPGLLMNVPVREAVSFNSRLAGQPAFADTVAANAAEVLKEHGFDPAWAAFAPASLDNIRLSDDTKNLLADVLLEVKNAPPGDREKVMRALESSIDDSPFAPPTTVYLVLVLVVGIALIALMTWTHTYVP